MKSPWYYIRYAAAALLLYLVFGWAKEHMETEKPSCPIGQRATQDSDKSWRCMCNDPALTLIDGLCQAPPKVDPFNPSTYRT
jgi:hypothetical protein